MPAGPARVRNLSHDPHDFSAGTHAADHRRPTVQGVEWFGRTDITGGGGALHLAPDLAGQPTHDLQVSDNRGPGQTPSHPAPYPLRWVKLASNPGMTILLISTSY
jgi:hypothetical protein